MRIFSDVYRDMCSFENLYRAYTKARRLRKNRKAVLFFDAVREQNLGMLSYQLHTGVYRHGAYREFIINDSKKRRIRAAPFRDRVVHHAVVAAIEPLFEKRFIHDSYVCRKHKGSHAAVKRLRTFMYSVTDGYTHEAYFLKLDVSKYFQNIDHTLLSDLICRVVNDAGMCALLAVIINSSSDSVIAGRAKGIPIGNLTSQLFANIYLNELDHYVKERLYCRYYVRYMDDMVICAADKSELERLRVSIEFFLRETLLLIIHPHKVLIQSVASGVPFLGYVLFPHYTRLRSSTVRRCRVRIKKQRALVQRGKLSPDSFSSSQASWFGYAKHANAWKVSRRVWERIRKT
ncbi:MAG: reverse transcriptase domain-containing protein [Ignavibacteriaceae bacterium]